MRITLTLLLILSMPAEAQVVVTGTVSDGGTGVPLPAATVQVEGTTSGTITNAAGAFEISVRDAPAELLVRFIGYESARVPVPSTPEQQQIAIVLQPTTVTAPEVVVTADDPAENIMRRVIAEKERRESWLTTWQAEAYARQTIARDTGIVAIAEGATTAFWRRGDGIREVVRGARQTANMEFLDAEFVRAAEAVINLHDDEIPFGGYRLMGPTAPGALRFYRFSLDSTRTRDDHLIYDILMAPRNGLQPGFEGRVSVMGDEWVIIDAALRPNDVVRFPGVPDFEIELAQQFIGLPVEEGAGWLPADYRFSGHGTIGIPGLRFPEIHFRNVVRLTDYQVNVAVPDSLFETTRRAVVDHLAVEADTVLNREGLAIPMEPREAEAYARIDSTDALEEAFRPTGLLARFVNFEVNANGQEGRRRPGSIRLRPDLHVNRVEGAHLGAGLNVTAPAGIEIHGLAGYATGLEQVAFDVGVSFESRARRVAPFANVRWYREHARMGDPPLHPALLTSVATLLGGPDHYDYYERVGTAASAGIDLPRLRLRTNLGIRADVVHSLPATSNLDLLGRTGGPRPNPAASAGVLHAVSFGARWGQDPRPFSSRLFPGTGVALHLEGAEPDVLGGDFAYLRAGGSAHVRLPTFLRRRLFPMMLDLRLAGGVSRGDLPRQRHFSIDGTELTLAPAGTLCTLRGLRAYGDHYVAATWEHDFRTVPFEAVGLTRLADWGFSLQLHGGHARTWNAPVGMMGLQDWRHEIGIGMSGGLTVPVRIDVTARLDAPGVFLSIGLPRL